MYTLYHNRSSICSIMVRYTVELCAAPGNSLFGITIEDREVDIFKGEQLQEEFLRDVNPMGQVSCLLRPT